MSADIRSEIVKLHVVGEKIEPQLRIASRMNDRAPFERRGIPTGRVLLSGTDHHVLGLIAHMAQNRVRVTCGRHTLDE
jgi:hypothetical protein